MKLGLLMTWLLCLCSFSQLAQAETPPAHQWQLLLGYGESHPGWGGTHERVKTRDLILRQERPQTLTHGRDWYLNRRSLQIELPLHLLQRPDEPPMFGIYVNSCWTFEANPHFQPYLLVGGGALYTRAEIPGTSSKLKGSSQAGIGLKFDAAAATVFHLEYRFHHVSNGGIKQPNDPLNSGKLLMGFSLPF